MPVRISAFFTIVVLFALPLRAGLTLSPPLQVGELRYGGAWNLQDFPTAVWSGEHFVATWVEHQGSPPNRKVIKAARFTEQGERVDPFGIEVLTGSEIRYARIVPFEGSRLLLWSSDEGIHTALLDQQFRVTPRDTIRAGGVRAFDAAVMEDRVLVSWANEDRYGFEAWFALTTNDGLVLLEPELADHDGYWPSVAAGDDGFLLVYATGGYSDGGVEGRLISIDGTVGSEIEIAPREDGVFSPSVAFTGDHYLVSFTARFRDDGLRLRTVTADGELGPQNAIGSGNDTTTISCNAENCVVVSTYNPQPCRITCAEPVSIAGALVSHDGHLIEEGLGAHEVYRNTWPDLASSPTRHFMAWEYSPGWSDDRGRGVFIDRGGISEDFPLSLSATSQRFPVSAGDAEHTLIAWEESGEEPFEHCLRGSIGSTGAEPIEVDVAPCRMGLDFGREVRGPSYSVSWDGVSWLIAWTEQASGGPYQREILGRIVYPDGRMEEPFSIAITRSHGVVAAGGDGGHIVVWAEYGSILASRITSTGLVVESPHLVVWNEYDGGQSGAGSPFLIGAGDGFILGWNQVCPDEAPPEEQAACGLLTRTLDSTGRTVDLPRRIGGVSEFTDVARSADGALIAWIEADYLGQSTYDYRIRTVALNSAGVSEARTIGTIRTNYGDPRPGLILGPREGGFVFAIANDRTGREPLTLMMLDDNGAPTGVTLVIDGSVEEIIEYLGTITLIEAIYESRAPYYGVNRLFLRTIEERLPRKRPLRR